MARKASRTPTESELAILQVLWDRGPATVRQVHEHLAGERATGYTTTLKLMQIMAGKGLVRRDASQLSHVYTAAIDRHKTQQHLVGQLVDRVFGGSAAPLVMQALAAKKPSPEELQQVRALIDTYARQQAQDSSPKK